MEIRAALKEQYHAGFAMLANCVDRCPDDLWGLPNPSGERCDRAVWRIAFHDVFFTHLYMGQNEAAFQPPPPESAVGRRPELEAMWREPWGLEPYELPADAVPVTREELMAYLRFVDGLVDSVVDGLDLDTAESGFHWYKSITKLSHQLMNLRHMQGHVGQISELLMQRGIDTNWISRPKP